MLCVRVGSLDIIFKGTLGWGARQATNDMSVWEITDMIPILYLIFIAHEYHAHD